MGAMKRRQVDREDAGMRVPRLGDLATGNLGVFCWCNRCGHNAVMAAEALIRRMGAEVPVPEIGSRMRCSACDSKNVATRPAWPQRGAIARHHRPADPAGDGQASGAGG